MYESSLGAYKLVVSRFDCGEGAFIVGHLSQIPLIPKESRKQGRLKLQFMKNRGEKGFSCLSVEIRSSVFWIPYVFGTYCPGLTAVQFWGHPHPK